MDEIKKLQEKQTSNLLKAIELKNVGIINKDLDKVVDYIIDHEIAELKYDVVLFDRGKSEPKEYKFK